MRETIRFALTISLLTLVAALPAYAGQDITYIGPSAEPYLSSTDSPFPLKDFGFCLETFEDGTFDIPGATGNGSVVGPGGLADSVDGDDGNIDGSGTNGRSYFQGNGAGGIILEFTLGRTNGYPTSVGLVWTDGGAGAAVSFEVFGVSQNSLGVQGPFVIGDQSNVGQTAEDRFFGATSADGISKIIISNTGGGIEVDHIQLNHCVVCGDANFDLHLTATDALLALKTSVGAETCLLCVCDTNNSTANTATDALAILKKSVGIDTVLACPACVLG
jgi:hypothetical protein